LFIKALITHSINAFYASVTKRTTNLALQGGEDVMEDELTDLLPAIWRGLPEV